jgi:hypothetical protein
LGERDDDEATGKAVYSGAMFFQYRRRGRKGRARAHLSAQGGWFRRQNRGRRNHLRGNVDLTGFLGVRENIRKRKKKHIKEKRKRRKE